MDASGRAPGEDGLAHSSAVQESRSVVRGADSQKGDLVIAEGRIENRSYQKEGQTHYMTEIAVREGRGDIQLMAKAATERPDGTPWRSGNPQPAGAG